MCFQERHAVLNPVLVPSRIHIEEMFPWKNSQFQWYIRVSFFQAMGKARGANRRTLKHLVMLTSATYP